MQIRTFLRKFARACRYRTDAADVYGTELANACHRGCACVLAAHVRSGRTSIGSARSRALQTWLASAGIPPARYSAPWAQATPGWAEPPHQQNQHTNAHRSIPAAVAIGDYLGW
jgi:hypothetical protein